MNKQDAIARAQNDAARNGRRYVFIVTHDGHTWALKNRLPILRGSMTRVCEVTEDGDVIQL